MPINLRYGQQAVARGFINKQRLDQILAKQRQLAEQGKKVSVRMILEKAKLLSPDQLAQIDRDLNIKVVKKHTAQIKKPGTRQPVGAQDFAGEAVPQFSGMQGADPDATVFSPPPEDMQARIREEREKAKAEARRKQEQEAASFFGDESASPFGDDPFGGGDMAPEPAGFGSDPFGGGEMSPEPSGFGNDPFGGDMAPEPFGGEMQPEPMGGFAEMQPMGGDPFGGDDLAPQSAGFDDDQGFGNEPAELDRMDSSPKLASLGAEFDGFANPEDEELPTLNAGFDDGGYAPQPQQQQWGQQQPQYDEGPALAPSGSDDFADFGNDIRSPEELEATPSGGTKPLGGDMDATMFSPPPPGMTSGGRQKTGAMDRTVFSPRPPEFGGAQPMEAEPAGDDWGEEPSMDAGFGDDDGGFGGGAPTPADAMDATLFSPPPAQMPPARKATGPVGRGRKGDDDFGDVEFPKSGQRVDDVPTAPASMDDEVHPLRRGVGTSSAGIKHTSRKQPRMDEDVADELPQDMGVDVPDDIPDELPEEAVPPVGKGKGKLPGKAPKAPATPKRELPQKEVPAADKKEKKGAGKRVLLLFTILLLIFVALLVLPIVLQDQVPQLKQLREHEQAKPIYDYVDYEIMDRIREWTGQPTHKPKPEMREIPGGIPDNTGAPDNGEPTDGGTDTGGEADAGADTGGEGDGGADTGGEADGG